MRDLTPEPCTQDALDQGCSCSIPFAGPTDIDPPEPRIDRDCPLHGTPDDGECGAADLGTARHHFQHLVDAGRLQIIDLRTK